MLLKIKNIKKINSYKVNINHKKIFLREILKLNDYHQKNSPFFANICKIKNKNKNKKK